MSRPVVAIIGRQNVGKSTLLNRLTGERIAITDDTPGTTRDRISVTLTWADREFTVVDTGGLEPKLESSISHRVREQVQVAIEEADLILFVVDARDGLTPFDEEIANMVRATGKPTLLVANKVDDTRIEASVPEFYRLGMGEPVSISAYHARGTNDLLDRTVALLPPAAPEEEEGAALKIAIVGRPNVGKSMLLNAILGTERAIVSETPGTTRDAIDTRFDFQGQNVILIDTAGIRRRGKVEVGVERYSVIRALRAIDRSDVALLVIDATEPFTAQDLHVAGYIQQAAKGMVLIVNKWDLVVDKNLPQWREYIKSQLRFMPYTSAVFTSAKLGQGIDRVIPEAFQVHQERIKRLPAAALKSIVEQAIASHVLPRHGNKDLKLYSVTQADINPPTFVFQVNDPGMIHFSYRRFLENKLRQSFGFAGTPIRLIFKARGEA